MYKSFILKIRVTDYGWTTLPFIAQMVACKDWGGSDTQVVRKTSTGAPRLEDRLIVLLGMRGTWGRQNRDSWLGRDWTRLPVAAQWLVKLAILGKTWRRFRTSMYRGWVGPDLGRSILWRVLKPREPLQGCCIRFYGTIAHQLRIKDVSIEELDVQY